MDERQYPEMQTFDLTSEHLYSKMHDLYEKGGGVYIVRAIDGQSGQRRSIPRTLAVDTTGILYVGKAISYVNRVIELKKSVLPNYKTMSHEFASRLAGNDGLSTTFLVSNLRVSLVGSSDPFELESKMLSDYEKRFGELPPFNRVGGKSV